MTSDNEWKISELERELRQDRRKLAVTLAERDKLLNEVRYRLGDALVSAYYDPRKLLALPRRVGALFLEGFRRQLKRAGKYGWLRRFGKPVVIKPAPAPARTPQVDTFSKPTPDFKASVAEPKTVEPRRPDIRVAAILDEFSMECFRHECSLEPVGRHTWRDDLARIRPAFLFVESAWHGNDDEWQGEIIHLEKRPDGELRKLTDWCRQQKIPTVFWNKEDPVNFEHFVEATRLFDFLFTTDENCIPEYRKILGHDRIWALPFAAQPAIHNPMTNFGNRPSAGSVAFAGAWYSDRHTQRRQDMHTILRPALRFGLHIYDRFANIKDRDTYRFPDEYQIAIKGHKPYSEMLDLYRRYKIFLNVNSVQDSPTMFSRRVLELLACRTSVLSGYSLGVEKMLGPEIVPMARTEEDTGLWLEVLLNNSLLRERIAHRGMRKVMTEHTYSHRFESILEKVGMHSSIPHKDMVSIVTCTNRPDEMLNILGNYDRQLHPNRELILVLNDDSLDIDQTKRLADKRKLEKVTVLKLPAEKTLGECLNLGAEHAAGDYVAKFDDDDFYGPHYLTDALLPFGYTQASVVGKRSHFAYLTEGNILAIRSPGLENQYADFMCGGTLLIKREVFDSVRFAKLSQGEDTDFLERCTKSGLRLYSSDRYNFVQIRKQKKGTHSWDIGDAEYLRSCQIVAYTADYQSQAVV